MTARDLQTLFDYGHWADRKLLAVIARLTPEQFRRTVDATHGCVRNTMVHLLSAEWGWINRCGGGPPRGAALSPSDYPTPESLLNLWEKVEAISSPYVAALRDEDLSRVVEFTIAGAANPWAMPVGELLHHATTHGVHHRGQVSLLLRLMGYEPENFDVLLYFAERRAGAAR